MAGCPVNFAPGTTLTIADQRLSYFSGPMLRPTVLITAIAPLVCAAQTMQLAGGSLHVQPGTNLTVHGPVQWLIAPGASVINDGTIDLGQQASVIEQPGAPITGLGVERAQRIFNQAFVQEEPGGLGLRVSGPANFGLLGVTRGHVPFSMVSGEPSVARWYTLDSPPLPGVALELRFAYDATELNGLAPAALALFNSANGTDPWLALASTPDAGTYSITATGQWPWGTLAAFDADAGTGDRPAAAGAVTVWPTLADDVVYIAAGSQAPISWLQVFDAHGALVLEQRPTEGQGPVPLNVGALAAGPLLLRVNGSETYKLMKR
jgi:hypothetical protein